MGIGLTEWIGPLLDPDGLAGIGNLAGARIDGPEGLDFTAANLHDQANGFCMGRLSVGAPAAAQMPGKAAPEASAWRIVMAPSA